MTRACLAVAAVSAKKGGAASKIKKTMLDSKKAKRTAALQRVRRALGRSAECRPESPPRLVAERPGLAGPQRGRSTRLCLVWAPCASRLIANASTRQTPVVVQASTEAGEVPESPFVLDTSNPFAALMSPSPVKLASPSPAKKRTPAAPRRV